ncbi:MAG: cysteine desulfurase family protein, partial [Aggregatilineales bacterium]
HHLITTPIEHSAIIKTVAQLADLMDFEQTLLPVDEKGTVRPEDFANACRKTTTVASIMYANNEVGTIQPIQELAAIAREHNVIFHTDAVQAAGQLSLDVEALGVDMMSISAHKFYGPKGVGALYIRDGIDLISSQSGGSHERGRRAGTHNTPLIVGMAKALELAYSDIDTHNAHYEKQRDLLIAGVLSRIPEAQLTGDAENRLPCHASFVFPGIDGNKLLMHLDMKGVAGSSASACKSGNPSPSSVLLAMGYDEDTALSSLRLTVGRQTTAEDIHYTVDVLEASINKMQKLKEALAQ